MSICCQVSPCKSAKTESGADSSKVIIAERWKTEFEVYSCKILRVLSVGFFRIEPASLHCLTNHGFKMNVIEGV